MNINVCGCSVKIHSWPFSGFLGVPQRKTVGSRETLWDDLFFCYTLYYWAGCGSNRFSTSTKHLWISWFIVELGILITLNWIFRNMVILFDVIIPVLIKLLALWIVKDTSFVSCYYLSRGSIRIFNQQLNEFLSWK